MENLQTPFDGQELNQLLALGLGRRQLLKSVSATGLGVAGLAAFANALPASAHQDHAASPVPGPQEDGSTLWKVVIGGMDMDTMVEYHGFFPGEITINAGDSIWFAYDMPMFHTVTFPGPEELPGIFIPDPEVAADATPAGPPKLIYNPLLMTGAGGTAVDGSQLVTTPVDVFSDPSVPVILSFPAPGEFPYVCIPHASVMQAKVIVQEAGSAYPLDQAGIDALAAEQVETLRADGLAQIEMYSDPQPVAKSEGGNLWEVAAGAGGPTQVRVQRFLPDVLTIAAGDSVRFINQSEGEPHTVTFLGEGETAPADTIEETFADGSPKLVQSMETFLPSGGNVWSGSGFVNSGFMGIPQLGLPMEFEVLFDTPGEYIYYCILHGDPEGGRMAARLIVE